MGIKAKIYLTLTVWLVFCAGMFAYGFGFLQHANHNALAKISEEKDRLLALKAEQESYRLAKQDLDDLAKKQHQPDDFFSRDISLVKEIRALENLGKLEGVDLSLGGIAGTVNSLPKAKTQSGLLLVPYSISISGPLTNVVDFIETLENLEFITTINSLSIGVMDKTNVHVSMNANLYIRKP